MWNKSGFLGSLPPVLEAQEEGARACFLGTCVRLPTLPPKTPTDKSPLPLAKNSFFSLASSPLGFPELPGFGWEYL